MRRITFRLLAVVLFAASADASTPIDGVWRSDRERTLAALEARGGFSAKQWQALTDPALFGHMVQVFRAQRGFVIFDGECSPWVKLEIRPITTEKIRVRYLDDADSRDVAMFIRQDQLIVPIQALKGAHEVFSKVSNAAVAADHPCFTERLNER